MDYHEQIADACIKAAKANHYLIRVDLTPMGCTYEQACAAQQILYDAETDAVISHPVANRALQLLSTATGFSLFEDPLHVSVECATRQRVFKHP